MLFTIGILEPGVNLLFFSLLTSKANLSLELSKFKYAVQFGTGGAGSFNLNCAYLGIPCIGLKALETQNLCFPDLSIDDVDLKKGKELAYQLKNDKDFYDHCAQQGQENYTEHFAETKFVTTVNDIFKKHYDIKYN